MPQLTPSEVRSVHAPPQSEGHVTHAPPLHDSLGAQECPQEPQLATSPSRSVHTPAQTVEHGKQAPPPQN